MSCTALQTQLNALRTREREQAALVAGLPDNPGKEHATEVLNEIRADIASTQAALDLCLAQEEQEENPVPQDILGQVDKIQCHAASKEVGADEPYLIIAAFDMTQAINLGIVGLTFPGINVVKVGPWADVDKNEVRYASELTSPNRAPFWNLSGVGSPIAHFQNVIFLVALLEHDGSSPDNIRGLVKTELLLARATNTELAYDAYVTNMISNMTGTIDTARLVPGQPSLNFDDLIGGVQQLRLTTNDLDLNGLEPVTKSLRFTQRKANGKATNDYTVTFTFTV